MRSACDIPAALHLGGVTVSVPGRTILDVPALTLRPGETLAVVGPNGAGKSTLLELAALLRRPDRGEVWLGGTRATRRNTLVLRRQTAMVFQAPLLLDTSVLANAAAGLRFRGMRRRQAEAIAGEWLARFGVGELARRSPRGLSAGEAKRVSLARAFAVSPALLLLDEPFTALDAPGRAAIIPDTRAQLAATGAATGTAAILVTHDLAEAMALGDRLAILLAGRIVQDGPPADVLARPATLAVARLLGIHTLLPATVVARGPDRLQLTIGDQPLTLPATDLLVSESDDVTLAMHPNQITLGPPSDAAPLGWRSLRGTVERVTLTPNGATAEVDCGVPVTAHLPLGCTKLPTKGDAVSMHFLPEAVHLIGSEKSLMRDQ